MSRFRFVSTFCLCLLILATGCSSDGGLRGDNGIVDPEPPARPEISSITGGDGFIQVAFTEPADADGYDLVVSEDSTVDPETDLVLRVFSSPGYYTRLEPSEGPFYFAVRAYNDAGESDLSNTESGSAGPASGAADPLYSDQWHLENTGQEGGTTGQDVDADPVWEDDIRGLAAIIAVVDDGVQISHEDLRANVVPGLSFSYLDGSDNPTPPDSESGHGTCVAGVAAARDLNGIGGRGAAPRAGIVGYDLLQDFTTSNEADAMLRNAADIWVSNNSWGPDDNLGRLEDSSALWQAAIDEGLSAGRGGLGIVYTWAAGNGGDVISGLRYDNSNFDGYANYRGVIAVCAVGDDGVKADYSEPGANLWVCTPSEGRAGHAITTVDLTGSAGYSGGNYTDSFNGTSSAAPLAAGVAALVLDSRPDLTWRDLRIVLAASARKNDPSDGDWDVNGAGFNVNHKYGFGVADAGAAVTLADEWDLLPAEEPPHTTGAIVVDDAIPDNDNTGISDTVTITGSGIDYIEWIEVRFAAADHPFSGDLRIELVNETTGTVSLLAERHRCFSLECSAYDGWRFGTARHLGEAADGDWTLRVFDLGALDTGTFESWQLTFYGH